MKISADILDSYPVPDEKLIDELLEKELKNNNIKLVVLDDDPTGVQTVHDVYVYTDWTPELLKDAFSGSESLFYILTNSRGLTAKETEELHRVIADRVHEAASACGCEYIFISRSDSTLRGHFPLETKVLKERYEANTGRGIDGEILCPFFKEGGRYTLNNIHYVRYGNELVPACETEFAKDRTFGYRSLTMPEYVEEKTAGEYRAEDVLCISLDSLRAVEIDKIKDQLMNVSGFSKVIVNAVDYVDLKVFATALFRAMASGKLFMLRTAAAIVKVMGGISSIPLLTAAEMRGDDLTHDNNGGIIIVGSHTAKTTAQVEALKTVENIHFIELDAGKVTDGPAFEAEISRCLKEEEKYISEGKTVCCYTTRKLITADTGDKEDELRLSVKISDAVQSLVGRLSLRPSFIIAKGGITSSDVGTRALAVKKALVLGQIEPGIPVWKTGEESTFPGVPYVIFPGNVGDDETLKKAAVRLMRS